MHARRMYIKDDSGEVSGINEEHVIGNWRKHDPCYKVANNLAELCSSVLWKTKLASDKPGFLTEEISKQSVGKVPWSFLTANRKRCKERNELKKESLSKKEPELEVW